MLHPLLDSHHSPFMYAFSKHFTFKQHDWLMKAALQQAVVSQNSQGIQRSQTLYGPVRRFLLSV